MSTLGPEILGEIVSDQYARLTHGSAETYVKLVLLMAGLGLTETQAFTVAKNVFKVEHAAYEAAVLTGELDPLIIGPHAGRFKMNFWDGAQWN